MAFLSSLSHLYHLCAFLGIGSSFTDRGQVKMSATAGTAEDDGPVVWCLPELFRSAPSSQSTAQYPDTELQKRPVCLLVLNQPLANLGLIRGFWQHCPSSLFFQFLLCVFLSPMQSPDQYSVKLACLRVAADGGANRLYEVGRLRGDGSFVRPRPLLRRVVQPV